MTPDEQARRRYTILTLLRAGGVVIMLLGLWLWHGSVARPGGAPEIGAPLFFAGAAASILVPHLLRRRWRSPGG